MRPAANCAPALAPLPAGGRRCLPPGPRLAAAGPKANCLLPLTLLTAEIWN